MKTNGKKFRKGKNKFDESFLKELVKIDLINKGFSVFRCINDFSPFDFVIADAYGQYHSIKIKSAIYLDVIFPAEIEKISYASQRDVADYLAHILIFKNGEYVVLYDPDLDEK